MKHPSLPVKRRSVKKGAFSTLFVNVAKKRHRASTSSSPMPAMEGDVPNVGVARALVVILAIHVVAIAGLFIHSKYFETKTEGGSTSKLSVVPQKIADNNNQAKLKDGERSHLITTGESYAEIAKVEQVNLKELQDLNNNVDLQVGRILRLPAKQISAVEPPEIAAARQGGDSTVQVNTLTSSSALTSATGRDAMRDGLPMVETTAASKVPRAIIVKPAVRDDSEPAQTSSSRSKQDKSSAKVAANSSSSKPKETKGASEAKATAATKKPATTSSSSKRVVKSGDTLWSIAKANGTTPAALMKANGIKDASRMRVGMELTIPKGN